MNDWMTCVDAARAAGTSEKTVRRHLPELPPNLVRHVRRGEVPGLVVGTKGAVVLHRDAMPLLRAPVAPSSPPAIGAPVQRTPGTGRVAFVPCPVSEPRPAPEVVASIPDARGFTQVSRWTTVRGTPMVSVVHAVEYTRGGIGPAFAEWRSCLVAIDDAPALADALELAAGPGGPPPNLRTEHDVGPHTLALLVGSHGVGLHLWTGRAPANRLFLAVAELEGVYTRRGRGAIVVMTADLARAVAAALPDLIGGEP